MTGSKLLSVKIPLGVYEAIPAAHKGRSQFIIEALTEKISREESKWKPETARGERLARLLKKGEKERSPSLDADGIAAELRRRRGALH